jgi:hypothetical protein
MVNIENIASRPCSLPPTHNRAEQCNRPSLIPAYPKPLLAHLSASGDKE